MKLLSFAVKAIETRTTLISDSIKNVIEVHVSTRGQSQYNDKNVADGEAQQCSAILINFSF